MPISEAIQRHPDLVKKFLGSAVPISDNFFATLSSAVFSDGSFVYVPPGVRCPMELSTYFRINERNTGQVERTPIIANKGSFEHEATTSKIAQDMLFLLHAARADGRGSGGAGGQRPSSRTSCSSCRWNSPSRRRS